MSNTDLSKSSDRDLERLLDFETLLSDLSSRFILKLAKADGNPNYVQSSVIAGVGGRALFFGRPQDSFGLAAYYYDLSDVLQESLSTKIDFRDESAIEVFYSFSVTPWLYVGADLQYIDPARGRHERALVAALRTQIRF